MQNTRPTYLVSIVDGNDHRRRQVVDSLTALYRVVEYRDAAWALCGLRTHPPDVLLVDESVAPHGGCAFVKLVRREPALADVPVILIARIEGDAAPAAVSECGANAHLARPYRRSALVKTISSLLNANVVRTWDALPEMQRAALARTLDVFNQIAEIIDKGEPIAYSAVKEACSPLVEAVSRNDFKSILNGVKDYDNYTYAHSLRVATLLSLLGYTLGLNQADLLQLASGGLLHDVGKMSIPHEVLNKPGRLTSEEWQVMKSHVTSSSIYLHANGDFPKAVMIIAEQHHEKLDGSGYPKGLAGTEINELARMASIVDVFSALTDRRVYKPPMEGDKALSIMAEEMTAHLDRHFLAMFRSILLDAVVDTVGERVRGCGSAVWGVSGRNPHGSLCVGARNHPRPCSNSSPNPARIG